MTIERTILEYYREISNDKVHRFRSWEHCFRYFNESTPSTIKRNKHGAAFRLGFYLASWGMYRPNGFLFKCDYSVHLNAIEVLVSPQLSTLWKGEFGMGESDSVLKNSIVGAISSLREVYEPFAKQHAGRVSDTLVTKVLLGVFGCLPACDQYFNAGFKSAQRASPKLTTKAGADSFVDQVLTFCNERRRALCSVQGRLESSSGIRYPIMRLVDMYFWKKGQSKIGR